MTIADSHAVRSAPDPQTDQAVIPSQSDSPVQGHALTIRDAASRDRAVAATHTRMTRSDGSVPAVSFTGTAP